MNESAGSQKVELTPKQGRWMLRARKFAAEVLRPQAAAVDRDATYPREQLRLLGRSGMLALPLPASKGGEDADVLTTALVILELAKGCASTAMCAAMHLSTVPLLGALATGEQQMERFIAPLLRGEFLGASAVSEFGSGSRVWHTDGHAEETETGWQLTADKSFVTNAGEADFYVVPVRSRHGADASDMSLFVIEGALHRVERRTAWDAMGFRGSLSSPVRFEKAPVPRYALLGPAGSGFSMMVLFHFPLYHVGLSALFIGIAEASLSDAIAHVKGRIHVDTGAALSSVETVQGYVGTMRMRIDQARAVLARVARLADRAVRVMSQIAELGLADELTQRMLNDDDFFMDVAGLKVVATECAVDVTNMAVQLCGGAAYHRGHPVERHYRDARAGTVMAPNNDSLRLIIGQQLLGYPLPWDRPGKPTDSGRR